MRTVISISDDTFRRVEAKAKELGIGRSQFFVTAAGRYLESLETDALADAVNAAVEIVGNTDPSNQAAVLASSPALAGESW